MRFAESRDLMHLSDGQRSALSLLFLAQHAPREGASEPEPGAGGFYVGYHHRLFHAVRSLGLRTAPCRDIAEFLAVAHQYDYIFSIYNRIGTPAMRNSMVFVSSVCDYLRVPYLGAPPNIRALAEDKHLAKALAASVGIPVLPGKVLHDAADLDGAPAFAGPYFVKPRFGAASEHITTDSLQATWSGARDKAAQLLHQGLEVLIERAIMGTDITVPVVGGATALHFPAIARPSGLTHGITTHEQKIFSSRPQQIVEAGPLQDRIADLVARLSEVVRPFDYFRVDLRRDDITRELFFLELNVACVLDREREFGVAAQRVEISFPALLEHIIAYSIARQKSAPGPRSAGYF